MEREGQRGNPTVKVDLEPERTENYNAMHFRISVIITITVMLAANASAITYLQIFDVPAPKLDVFQSAPDRNKSKKKGFFARVASKPRARAKSKPEWQMLLSERYALTTEGARRLERTAARYENETYRIRVYRCAAVLARSTRSNTEVVIDVGAQKVFLLVDGLIGLEAPISSARAGKETPLGSFRMTERVRDGKISNLYDVEMPFWMRLNQTAYGVHAGHLPGYPASAGCIRLPMVAAETIYNHTKRGSQVHIRARWSPPSSIPALRLAVQEFEPATEAQPEKAKKVKGRLAFIGGN